MTTETQTDETIEIANAPLIEGLSFRHYKGMADMPAMVAVLNVADPADGQNRVSTVEALTNMYSNLSNCDPYKDMVVVEVNGEVVGYTRVTWWVELDGTRIYMHIGFLKPDCRGKGIGTALIKYNEARLREIASEHTEPGHRWLDASAGDKMINLHNILQAEGYKPIRYGYDMVRPNLDHIPHIPMPEGLETRPVKNEDLHTIWAGEVEAFRDHWGATEPTEGDFERWKLDTPFQPEYWQVAWDTANNEVAGMVRAYVDDTENKEHKRLRGYTENISVRRPYRRKGLASALIARSFQMQKELGLTETALSVDATNPNGALQLYESMGFRVTHTGTEYRKAL